MKKQKYYYRLNNSDKHNEITFKAKSKFLNKFFKKISDLDTLTIKRIITNELKGIDRNRYLINNKEYISLVVSCKYLKLCFIDKASVDITQSIVIKFNKRKFIGYRTHYNKIF
jgi:hypothetical protein